MSKLLTTINARIVKIGAAEKITKAELGAISREILEYTLAEWDSQVINRLTAVLTPMNKKTATLFFSTFTPFILDEDTGLFGAIQNKKAKATSVEMIGNFLNTDGDIWSWAMDNIKVEKKEIDYLGKITKDVQKALDNNSREEVLQAVFAGGISSADVMTILATMQTAPVQAEQVVQ